MGSARRGGNRDAPDVRRPSLSSPSFRDAAGRPPRLFLVNAVRSLNSAVRHRLRGLARGVISIGKRDRVQAVLLRILGNLRIDVEYHRQIPRLARSETLLGEAEAVDLLKIQTGLRRRNIIAGLTGGLARRKIGHLVEDRHHLADTNV